MELQLQRIDANITPAQLSQEIADLEKQIQSHPEDAVQNKFDTLQIEREERRLTITEAILKEHPELDPNNKADRKTLAALADAAVEKDSDYNEISDEMALLSKNHPYECTKWGLFLIT
ncbi:MAG TPA: hypothetical protein VLE89_01275 [Chlamydiales bacterium]|nr:hypothetical protein [Chlamydiales bacterium]